jgi:Contact-dependent growth inhibition CdiA C-terminal domain
VEQISALLADALEGVTRPDAEEALASSAAAGDLILEAIELLRRGDAALEEYSAQVLLVGATGAPGGTRAPIARADVGGGRSVLTVPSRNPDPAAEPEGEPEFVDPRSQAIVQESVRIQNATARMVAAAGYRIRQLPKVPDQPSPDYEIEGRTFDCYAPRSSRTLKGIRTKLSEKIKKAQADRFVVNLDFTPHSPDDLRRHLIRDAPSRLREVIVVKDGVISHAWPELREDPE